MQRKNLALLLAALLAACGGGDAPPDTGAAPVAAPDAGAADGDLRDVDPLSTGVEAQVVTGGAPAVYAIDFVATAATGFDMNAAGDVVGRAYTDIGCGPFCLPPQEIVVWTAKGERIPLQLLGGLSAGYHFPRYINTQGAVAGEVGYPGSQTRATLWTRSGATYTAQDLGTFPGTSSAAVHGLDDAGRIVGWATQGGAIPTLALPFMWSQTTGMVNLNALGFPNGRPAAISRGGKVVTTGDGTSATGWTYDLDEPPTADATVPALPLGFYGAGSNGSAINDNGDQAHFLVRAGSQNLVYPFRLPRGGTWQQISTAGSGSLSRYGMGSIDKDLNVSFTTLSMGMVAAGPAGQGVPLAHRLSPAYDGAEVTFAGAMNEAGRVLAQVVIGRSTRLVRLVPAAPCGSNCIRVASLTMNGNLDQGPGSTCLADGKQYNLASATVKVTDENGAALARVQVRGRFLDDYWTDRPVTVTTDAAGSATLTHRGLCGTGAITFLVDGAALDARTLDRTHGSLVEHVIPGTTTTVNQPPVASAVVTCATFVCTFDATRSSDDAGITAYEWRDAAENLLSTQAVWSRTYPDTATTASVVLTVFDGDGLSRSQTVTFDPQAWPAPVESKPVPVPVVTCYAGYKCSFDGTRSYDTDGKIVGWRWTASDGTLLSTQSFFSQTFKKQGGSSVTLTVTDDDAYSAAKTVQFTIRRK